MKKRLQVLLLVMCMLFFPGCQAAEKNQTRSSKVGFYFDTVVTLALYGAPEGTLDTLLAACARYEQLLSKTVEGSDVWRINHAQGQPVTVDAETMTILQRAKALHQLSGGAFSITVAPLVEKWDFTGGTQIIPPEEDLTRLLPLVDDSQITLDGLTVTMPAGFMIDLGGIAKGYIADQLADMVRKMGLSGTLNFGGNVYAVGQKPDGSPFRVGLRDPQAADQTIAVISVRDETVVTSGVYERGFVKDGVLYHHILDPKTGQPARTGLHSVTILGHSSMDADALATACVVLGLEKGLALLESQGINAVFVDGENHVTCTAGLLDRYDIQWGSTAVRSFAGTEDGSAPAVHSSLSLYPLPGPSRWRALFHYLSLSPPEDKCPFLTRQPPFSHCLPDQKMVSCGYVLRYGKTCAMPDEPVCEGGFLDGKYPIGQPDGHPVGRQHVDRGRCSKGNGNAKKHGSNAEQGKGAARFPGAGIDFPGGGSCAGSHQPAHQRPH